MKRFIGLSLLCIFLLTGCAGSNPAMQTPEDTIQTAFTALKELDMDTFNACTNNKMAGGYRIMSDLFGKQDEETYRQLAEAMVEHLSWEIKSVEINEDTAIATVTIHNRDFSDAIGMYLADLIKQINQDQKNGMDLSTLIRNTIEDAKNSPEHTLPYLKKCTEDFSVDTQITLKQTDKGWQILLDESLCDSLTGHLGTKKFSDQVSAKVTAAEELLQRNLERWGVSENSDQWTDKLKTNLYELLK